MIAFFNFSFSFFILFFPYFFTFFFHPYFLLFFFSFFFPSFFLLHTHTLLIFPPLFLLFPYPTLQNIPPPPPPFYFPSFPFFPTISRTFPLFFFSLFPPFPYHFLQKIPFAAKLGCSVWSSKQLKKFRIQDFSIRKVWVIAIYSNL